MKTRSLALPTIALTILLTSTTALAQYHQRPLPQNPTNPTNPVNPVNPGSHRYDQPTPIVIPTTPSSTFSESMVFGPNGQVTIIQQQGSDVFVTTY